MKIIELKKLKKKNYINKEDFNEVEIYGIDAVGVALVSYKNVQCAEVFVRKENDKYFFKDTDFYNACDFL